MHERADVAEHALLGVLADGAGVEDDDVRALRAVGEAVTGGLEHAADALGIRFVLLAAVGVDEGDGRDALRRPIGLDLVAEFRLPAQFLLRNNGSFCIQGRPSDKR